MFLHGNVVADIKAVSKGNADLETALFESRKNLGVGRIQAFLQLCQVEDEPEKFVWEHYKKFKEQTGKSFDFFVEEKLNKNSTKNMERKKKPVTIGV